MSFCIADIHGILAISTREESKHIRSKLDSGVPAPLKSWRYVLGGGVQTSPSSDVSMQCDCKSKRNRFREERCLVQYA